MIPRVHLVTAAGLLAAMLALSAYGWFHLPPRVPTHWDIHSNVTRHGSVWELLLVLPGVSLVLLLLMVFLPRIDPLRVNFERFRITYGRIISATMGIFAALHALMLLKPLGLDLPHSMVLVLLGVLFVLLGNWLGKIRRNFWIGIRTPWTLASDIVWERTHRLGGRFMVVLGLLVIAAGFLLPSAAAFIVLIGGSVALGAWAIAYSAWLYWHMCGGR